MLKNRFLICIRIFFILTSLLTAVSCSLQNHESVNPKENPDLVDQSWLVDKPCSAPCWQGIEPGISSQQKAIQIVKDLSFVDGKSMRTYKSTVSFLCRTPSNVSCVYMEFDNGLLFYLQLYVNYQLSIKQVVDKLGPPDSYIISRRTPEMKGCDAEFLWINRQLSVEYHEELHNGGDDLCDIVDAQNGKIPDALYVQSVNYMKASEMDDKIQTVQKPDTGYNYILWKGFSN